MKQDHWKGTLVSETTSTQHDDVALEIDLLRRAVILGVSEKRSRWLMNVILVWVLGGLFTVGYLHIDHGENILGTLVSAVGVILGWPMILGWQIGG